MGALTRLVATGFLACLLAACGTPSDDLRTASDTTANQKLANIRLQLASGYYRDGKYEIALDEVKKAIVADPDHAQAYGMRGLVYGAMGEPQLAEASFKRALDLSPRDPELANNYGSFLCQHGRAEKSIDYFESALSNRNYGSPVSALINAGNCSIKLKRLDVAERYLLEARRFAPDLPQINIGLGRIYFERGNYTGAHTLMRGVLATNRVESLSADVLWLAVRIGRKVGDRSMESSLVAQLHKQFPSSPEYAAFQRGAFDE